MPWRPKGISPPPPPRIAAPSSGRPDFAAAYKNLGIALQGQGKADEAAACYRRAVQLSPNDADAHNLLADALRDQGKLADAVACYRRALELKPDFPEACNNLGIALKDQGQLAAAVACYRRALELRPDFPEACNNLGIALKDQGQLDDAVAAYRRALELRPDYAAAHNNLGVVLSAQGRPDEAVACYRRAIEIQPDLAEVHSNLGNTLRRQGKFDEAIASFRRALELRPAYADAHNNLGTAMSELGKLDEAVACYRRALELEPDHAETHNNLGVAFKERGDLDNAVACYRRALELTPDAPHVHSNLAIAFREQGKLDEAVASCRRALELKPDSAGTHSNLLLTLQYRDGMTLAGLAAAHREYDQTYARPLRKEWRPHENVHDRAQSVGGSRRLRVGFVSPDFGRHPVGHFAVRCLENLDPGLCETVCYSDRITQDDLTARFRAAAALWRDVVGLSDERLAEQIRSDRIDILFDLMGHTGVSRLLVFARKPAPIQIAWIGYEGTTGLEAMDYILANRYTIRAGMESFYRERVLRMPDGYVCFDPPAIAPEPGPLPAIQNGYVRFGSFNNPAKITPRVFEVWAKVLERVPQSRLMLKYRGLGDASVRERYLGRFAALGIDPTRIELTLPGDYAEYLAAYRVVDIGLDPFPFGGGVTTCDALWMRVPVVVCPGETFASRHGLSHLANVGLTETVARDLNEYVEIAAGLAGDLPRLAAIRAGLRERMAASPLCDGKRFAENLMKVLRDVWRAWCETAQ